MVIDSGSNCTFMTLEKIFEFCGLAHIELGMYRFNYGKAVVGAFSTPLIAVLKQHRPRQMKVNRNTNQP
jgi:hypothetical protein